jgi:hypothetical protein
MQPRFALLLVATATLSCAQMRQNLRGQELSYRGAWHCENAGCSDKQMTRSTAGTRDGAVEVASVSLQPRAALAFTAATPFDRLDVKVEDCKGTSIDLDAAAIKRPGKHTIGNADARESWMILLDRGLGLKFGPKCRWTATVVATWSDGATFTSQAGIRGR